MIRTQRHSRFVLMSLDEIRATRDIYEQRARGVEKGV